MLSQKDSPGTPPSVGELPWRIEPVARATYGGDGLCVELAAQPHDARIDRTIEGVGILGRCRGDDVVTRQHLAGARQEQPEQRHLAGRKLFLRTGPVHDDGRSQIDGRVLQHDQFLLAPATTRQQAADPGGKLPDIERAFDDVGRTQFERQHLVDEIGRPADQDEIRPVPAALALAAITPEQIPPFRLAEAVANDDDLDAFPREQRFGLLRLPRLAHVMATPLEMVGKFGRDHVGDANKRNDGSCSHGFQPFPCNRI